MNRRQIDVIENAVTVPSVLGLHNVRTSGTRCRCPIHNGRRYSFSFTDKLFHCFTCGASGGVIQLEAMLDGTDDDTACHVLADQYALDIDRPMSKAEKKDAKLTTMIENDYKKYKAEQHDYYKRLSNLYRNIKDVPELDELARDLSDWLDANIEGVIQPWTFLNSQ